MSAIARALSKLESSLRAALPGRVVSTEFVDFAQRRGDELQQGVVTLLLPGGDLGDWETTLKLTLVGQITVPERTGTQRQLRDAELAMLAQLQAWISNPGDTPHLEASGFKTSSQMEYPNGWVSIELSAGPLDVTDGADDSEIYPPNLQPGVLRSVHMDIDMQHQPDSVHQQWLAGDYSRTQPTLSTTVELNHANNPNQAG